MAGEEENTRPRFEVIEGGRDKPALPDDMAEGLVMGLEVENERIAKDLADLVWTFKQLEELKTEALNTPPKKIINIQSRRPEKVFPDPLEKAREILEFRFQSFLENCERTQGQLNNKFIHWHDSFTIPEKLSQMFSRTHKILSKIQKESKEEIFDNAGAIEQQLKDIPNI